MILGTLLFKICVLSNIHSFFFLSALSSTSLAFQLTLDNISDSESGALKLRGKCDLDADPSLNPDPDSDTDGDTNAESDTVSDPVGDACLCLVCLWFVTRIDIDGLTEDFRRPTQITTGSLSPRFWAGIPLWTDKMSGLDGAYINFKHFIVTRFIKRP